MSNETRIEHDSLGEVMVPSAALYGAQTQRAVDNFPISGWRMPLRFTHALGSIKAAAARANLELQLLDEPRARAIIQAAREVAAGRHDEHFPVDVFQTGSGTSSNMNANEVIARLAGRNSGELVHPNDHVNLGQSSNDVVPTAIHLSAGVALEQALLPALAHLQAVIERRALAFGDVVKTGRTHLMDAMPLRLDQEMGAWARQIEDAQQRIRSSLPRLLRLAIGGTAVGTGVNTHRQFGARVAAILAEDSGLAFVSSGDHFRDLSCQDTAVEIGGQLNVLAIALTKIANDLRWMNSGPLAGLAEVRLPVLQPGSSIMPGKVNPVIPEAVAMVGAQVMGNQQTLTVAGQSGNFQLNVMLPLVAHTLLQSTELLSNASRLLADKAISGLEVNRDRLAQTVDRNPILVTALNAVVGYEKGAEIARQAYAEGRPVLEVAQELTGLGEQRLRELLDPTTLTR